MMNGSRKISVVTESPQIASIVTSKLVREGFKVLCSFKGIEGMKLIKSDLPDLIIIDSILPDIDGFELLRQIRTGANSKTIPVFILWDTLQEHSEEDFERAGADVVLVKPFRPTDLSKKIHFYLSQSVHYQRETVESSPRFEP